MASQRLDKLVSQFNYDLCISDSLIKFNNLVNGISNDYPKYLDLYTDYFKYAQLDIPGQPKLSTPNFVKTQENEKKYQQILNAIKIGFSNEILNLIKEIVDEYKYSSQQAVVIITEIRDFLDRYTKEENYNSIYSEVAIQKHPFAGLSLSHNGASQWKTDAYMSKFQIYEHFFFHHNIFYFVFLGLVLVAVVVVMVVFLVVVVVIVVFLVVVVVFLVVVVVFLLFLVVNYLLMFLDLLFEL